MYLEIVLGDMQHGGVFLVSFFFFKSFSFFFLLLFSAGYRAYVPFFLPSIHRKNHFVVPNGRNVRITFAFRASFHNA